MELLTWICNRKVSRRPKTRSVTGSFAQLVAEYEFDRLHFLDDQLGYTVSGLNMDFFIGVVEEKDFYFAPIMRVNHSGTAIESEFNCRSATRPDQTGVPFRKLQANSGSNQLPASRRNYPGFHSFQIGSGIALV